jgi:hypothetical protein
MLKRKINKFKTLKSRTLKLIKELISALNIKEVNYNLKNKIKYFNYFKKKLITFKKTLKL